MMEKRLFEQLHQVALAMFRKNMLGIYHGSMSARVELNKFLINKKEAIFDDLREDDFILLYHTKDYRWKDASIDSDIHSQIYKGISDSKFILYTLPPYTMSYAMDHESIESVDYFGSRRFPSIPVYDPGNYDDWYDRAEVEISRYFYESDENVMVIRGYGVYAHARDINELAKILAIVENSCRILLLSKLNNIEKKEDTPRAQELGLD
jgi:L-fuculose-phosphate aldolase